MRRALFVLLCFVVGTTAAASTPDRAEEVRKIAVKAIEKAFDDEAFRRYLATLPRYGDFYVVEGDLVMSEEEIREYLVERASAPVQVPSRGELIVNIWASQRDYYADPADRKLTYAIDRASFASTDEYRAVVKNMTAAAADWVGACPECGLSFTHVDVQDAKPKLGQVNFIVRREPLKGLIALAFFPHDAPIRRTLAIDASYFKSSFDKVGILRQEIGHILGYRHEQLATMEKRTAGCYEKEPGQWETLTAYTPASVMHYFCPKVNEGTKTLLLQDSDKEGHRKLYGPPTAARLTEAGLSEGSAGRGTPAGLSEPQSFDGFAASLPRDGKYFVYEGDLLLDEEELREKWLVNVSGSAATREKGLTLNRHDGKADYYKDVDDRRMSYAFGPDFPKEQYAIVAQDMRAATKAWMNACPTCKIELLHRPQWDGLELPMSVSFLVRYRDTASYEAASFLPHHDVNRRYLSVTPGYFALSAGERSTLLQHQLGHILGYLHSGPAGCSSEEIAIASVMSSLSCAAAGRPQISESDIVSHRALYGLPTLVVQLRGGEVSKTAAAILRKLIDEDLVDTEKHTVAENESIPAIFGNELEVPSQDPAMIRLAEQLNRPRMDRLTVGEKVKFPDVKFTPFEFTERLDPTKPAEVERGELIKTSWKSLLVDETKEGDYWSITFRGYELRVSHKNADKLKKIAASIPTGENTQVHVHQPQVRLTTYSHPRSKQSDWSTRVQNSHGKLRLHDEGYAGAEVGAPLTGHPCAETCTLGDCPVVYVIDKPVLPHPDVQSALLTPPKGTPLPKPFDKDDKDSQHLDFRTESSEHGTELAGLIASQINSFGLIGVTPAARIESINSELRLADPADLSGDIEKIEQSRKHKPPAVFLMATRFPYESTLSENGSRFGNAIANIIHKRQVLLVGAAGQPKAPDKRRWDLDEKTPFGPWNLGDQPGVITVAACDDCRPDHFTLFEQSNYSSRGFVHVAAPGRPMLSTAEEGTYAPVGGTSQASALTAGVAAAMIGCHPSRYPRPSVVKQRLVLTSTPIVSSSPDADGVAAGIVDANTALLDPTVHYLRRKEGGEAKPVEISWCGSKEARLFFMERGKRQSISTENIHRIYKKGDWLVFYLLDPLTDSIERRGPVKAADPFQPWFRIKGAEKLAPSQFQDLILSMPVDTFVSCEDQSS